MSQLPEEPALGTDLPLEVVPAESPATEIIRATTPDKPRQYLAFIHALRGVAAMMVVWAHLGTIWPSRHLEQSYLDRGITKLFVLPLRIYQDFGHLGVVLFFLISGYIITYTSLREDRTAFAVKRFMRLGPPLLVALVVVLGYVRVADAYGVMPIGIRDGSVLRWISSLFLLDGWYGLRVLDVTWTLVIEVIFYTLTFALLGLSRSRPEAATWAMTGAWAATCIFVQAAPGLSTSVNAILPGYVGFLLVGRCIYLWTAGIVRPITCALNAALGLLLFASFTEHLAPGLIRGITSPYAEPYYSYAYALIIFLGLMSMAPKRTVQPFTLLGDISYSLYLLHVPVGFTTFEVTSRWGFPPDLMIVSAVGTSIGAAWLGYRFVEHPAQAFARTLLSRRNARLATRTIPVHNPADEIEPGATS